MSNFKTHGSLKNDIRIAVVRIFHLSYKQTPLFLMKTQYSGEVVYTFI